MYYCLSKAAHACRSVMDVVSLNIKSLPPITSDIRTVSIDSVNKWVDCLSCCILEMGQRLDQQQRAVQSVSQSVRTGKQSYNSILDQNEALEEKLKIALKKISLAEMQKSLLGESLLALVTTYKK
jgi:hypothetical protein